MLEYKDCPELMRQQALEGKKDKYIEITDVMMAVDFKSLDETEKTKYVDALMEVLDAMDFQIYELYRALSDRFADIVKASFEEIAKQKGAAAKNELSRWIDWGVSKHFLLDEWFVIDEIIPIDISGKEKLEINIIYVSPRSFTFEIEGAGKYNTDIDYLVYINGKEIDCEPTVVKSIFGLLPSREYVLTVVSADGTKASSLKVTTKDESVTLNVKDFGAKGDGETDDTNCIQAAILSAPMKARVLLPEGTYRIHSIFLKSNIQLEFAKGAVLKAIPVRDSHGILPPFLPSTDGKSEYNFGTWEGNPLPMLTGILCGKDIENVDIYGEGILDGAASKDNWWNEPRKMRNGYRPRLFFLDGCKRVYMQGITLMNSPSWTIHPYFSDDLGFYNLKVRNPYDSPNTDGLDPESCRGVEIAGVFFSLGDDCIAVKSGKIYNGRKFKKPSESIRIHNCLMENGHGSVTVGSEMAGGVKNLTVENCNFSHTDRGLRVKTRRGRGKDAVLDRIIFRNISMDHVMTPFVVNSFYFCDPDGKTDYVQSRDLFPVDERTPFIKRLEFEDIDAKNCHVAAAYIEGLPEQKIEELIMRHINVSYAEDPKCDVPAMSNGVDRCSKRGIIVKNVKRVVLEKVDISGFEGDKISLLGVDEVN